MKIHPKAMFNYNFTIIKGLHLANVLKKDKIPLMGKNLI